VGDSRPVAYIGVDNLYVTSLGRYTLRRVAHCNTYTSACRRKARNDLAAEESRTAEYRDPTVTH
jgi:hypothetical protein